VRDEVSNGTIASQWNYAVMLLGKTNRQICEAPQNLSRETSHFCKFPRAIM
jgi:hypothetical protein